MTENEAFLRTIANNPEDDTARLVYADWQEEYGDPERAEFIRAKVSLAQYAEGKLDLTAREQIELEDRVNVILNNCKSRWISKQYQYLPILAMASSEYPRGFINEASIDAKLFIERGDDLWRVAPIEMVTLSNIEPVSEDLRHCPHLARIRHLEIYKTQQTKSIHWQKLLSSRYLNKLHALSIHNLNFEERDAHALVENISLPNVRYLRIVYCNIKDWVLSKLLNSLRALESLSLISTVQLNDSSFANLLASLDATRLSKLSLWDVPLGIESMQAIVAGRRFVRLKEIELGKCELSTRAIQLLAEATHLNQVTRLRLNRNPLLNDGGVALAAWPGLRTVQFLDLECCDLGSKGAKAIAQSPYIGSLKTLILSDNNIGNPAVNAIAKSRNLEGLRLLNLFENRISEEGCRALANSPYMSSLRYLGLGMNPIPEGCGKILAASPYLRSLRSLVLSATKKEGRKIVGRFPDLLEFRASDGDIPREKIQAIREKEASAKMVRAQKKTAQIQVKTLSHKKLDCAVFNYLYDELKSTLSALDTARAVYVPNAASKRVFKGS